MQEVGELWTGLRESLTRWLLTLVAEVRAAFSIGISQDGASRSESLADQDFQGWLRSDPKITGNPASRYGDDSPGRLTSNGLGSLEIGAADD